MSKKNTLAGSEFLQVKKNETFTIPAQSIRFKSGKVTYEKEQLKIDKGMIKERKAYEGSADLFVTPGFINCHMHWLMPADSSPFDDWVTDNAAKPDEILDRAITHARDAVKLGVTFGADKGTPGFCTSSIYRGMQEAIDNGAPMTNSLFSIWALMVHGSFAAPYGRIVTSPEEMKIVFLELEAIGAGIIKFIPESAYKPAEKGFNFVFPEELFRSARETARAKNLVFAVHAKGTETLDQCLAVGADCIEHGVQASAEQLRACQEKNIYLGATLDGLLCRLDHARAAGQNLESTGFDWEEVCKMVRTAATLNNGRPFTHMLFSSDAGSYTTPHASIRELYLMRTLGWQPADIFEAATLNGAKCLKQENRGSIENSKRADLIYWKKNPLELSLEEWEHLEDYIAGVLLKGNQAHRA